MKLKTFNAETCPPATRSGQKTIRFAVAGQITLSKAIVKELGLKIGDTISFHQDEEEEMNWFISVKTDDGFKLRQYKDADSLLCNNSAISKNIMDACFDVTDGYPSSVAFKVLLDNPEKLGGGQSITRLSPLRNEWRRRKRKKRTTINSKLTMENKTISIEALVKLYTIGDKNTKAELVKQFGKETFISPVGMPTTWEELAEAVSMHPINSLPFANPKDNREISVNADFVLDVLSEYINKDETGKIWKPNRKNSKEDKWFPVFQGNPGDGFSFNDSHYYHSASIVGSRHEYRDKARSDHAGKYFLKYYEQRSTI